jgi:hypothetical protein
MFISVLILLIVPFVRTSAYGDSRPDIQIIQAVADLGEVDLYLDKSYAGRLKFGGVGPFISVPAGSIKLTVLPAKAQFESQPLFVDSFEAKADQQIGVVLMGTKAKVQTAVYVIDRSPLPLGMSRVNLVNAMPATPTGNLMLRSGTSVDTFIVYDFGFGNNAVREFPATSYNYIGGGSDAQQGLARLFSGTVHTVVLATGADGKTEIIETKTAANLDGPAGFVRFVNAIPDGNAFNVKLDNKIVGGLFAKNASVYMALKPGKHPLAMINNATKKTELQATIDVQADVWQTAVIAGKKTAARLMILNDDVTPLAEGEIRLAVLNAADAPVTIKIDDQAASDALGAGQLSANQTLKAATHQLTIAASDNSFTLPLQFGAFAKSPFNLRTLIVMNGDTIMLQGCSPVADKPG